MAKITHDSKSLVSRSYKFTDYGPVSFEKTLKAMEGFPRKLMTECFGRCSQGVVVHRSLGLYVMGMMGMMVIRRVGMLMWMLDLIRKRWGALSGRKTGHAHFSILPKSQLDEHILPVMSIQL